jgi:hypothetical protein
LILLRGNARELQNEDIGHEFVLFSAGHRWRGLARHHRWS